MRLRVIGRLWSCLMIWRSWVKMKKSRRSLSHAGSALAATSCRPCVSAQSIILVAFSCVLCGQHTPVDPLCEFGSNTEIVGGATDMPDFHGPGDWTICYYAEDTSSCQYSDLLQSSYTQLLTVSCVGCMLCRSSRIKALAGPATLASFQFCAGFMQIRSAF